MALGTPVRSPDISTTSAALDGDVGAGADGDADIGLGQRRRIVDAVADEGQPAASPSRRRWTAVDLALGQHLGHHLVDAQARARWPRAVRRLSPVIIATFSPSACSAAIAAGVVALIGSATAMMAASRPSMAA